MKWLKILFCIIFLTYTSLSAAPVPPGGPCDIEGTIEEVQWSSEMNVKGIPGMSGSLRFHRVVPPHFLIKLSDYKGIDSKTFRIMKDYYRHVSEEKDKEGKPSTIILRLNHSDRDFLNKGMRIKVLDYKIMGDEGGDWSSYKEIRIIRFP